MESRSGELAMRSLPAVLLDLHEDLATGKLSLRRGRVAKSVDLVNGNPVSTASTPRDETLGHFLVTAGVISEEQHRHALQRATELGGKLGEALVALQVLTIEQLIDQLGKQARHKLVQALRWPQGAWRFDPTSEAVEGMQLRMVEVVLGGLRETAVDDLARLARLDGLSFELTERGRRLRHELRRVFGDRALAAISAGAPTSEVERAFGDRGQARTALDAMLMCDAIVAKTPHVGLGAPSAKLIPKLTIPGLAVTLRDAPAPTPAVSRAPTRQPGELYELLFDDLALAPESHRTSTGAAPLDFTEPDAEPAHVDDDASGAVSAEEIHAASASRERVAAARHAVAAEHARIQGADHYAVLLVERDAEHDDIDGAHQIKSALLERSTATITDPLDRAKLAEITAAYATARAVLLDRHKRAAYDRELAGGELVEPPAIDTELDFRKAEALIDKRQYAQALPLLKTVVARSPNEADYHAALGWAEWQARGADAAAADAARVHLQQALSINPDHAAAHDYIGRIDAALRVDDAEALFHLERAIDLDPARGAALAAIEALLVARGDVRRLERVLKKVLFRLRGRGGTGEASAWLQLARLYAEHLDDPGGASAALANAHRLAPQQPEVAALGQRLRQPRATLEPIRAGWREALADPQSGAALVRTTEAAGHGDAAFLAASTMVALGSADDALTALYEQKRVRGAIVPRVALGREHWAQLRHRDDSVELGSLLELIAPAVHALAPMTLADGELDASQALTAGDLPPVFARLCNQLAGLLGVEPPPVYHRAEQGLQIHVIACDPPVMVAGDEALTAPERPELVFRLARAMTFLWPGRAVGASRPGRVLRAVVLAVVREAAGSELGLDDALAARAAAAIATLPPDVATQARGSALRLLSRAGGGLNLSAWARSLSRTADRTGLLLCGDVPAAFTGAREVGDLEKDLVEFAYSAVHVALRGQLGLSRP